MASERPGRHSRAGLIGRGREAAAAIGADIAQTSLDAIGAEGAFESADARLGGVRRQVLVAIFAIRPKFERHVVSPKPSGSESVDPPRLERNLMPPDVSQSSRPLQNCVDPFGELRATPERGGLMGNRGGRLHRDDQTLSGGRWKNKHWLICVRAFKGRHRDVWGRGYTELFFLDEPTALAAGHRPCFECRRVAAKAFIAAFPGAPSGVEAMDEALHRERVENRVKRLWRARLGDLPDGAMIARDRRAHAVRSGRLLPWSFVGYEAPGPFDADALVDVLTPPSTVAALKAGYKPLWPEALKASP